MKKSIIILILFLLLFMSELIFCKRLISFPDINRPFSILIEGEKLLITDGPVIYIYSMKDFSLLKKFGKSGEGPGEFKVIASINRGSVVVSAMENKIMIASIGRVSFFSLNGEFLEQKNIQSLFGFGIIKPFHDHYVGLGVSGDANLQYFTLNFFDSEFKKAEEMFKIVAFEQNKSINPVSIGILPFIEVEDRRIFFLDYEGVVHMFDETGKEIRTFKISSLEDAYIPVKVTEERKETYIEYFLSDPRFKPQFERDRNNVSFPSLFPEIKDFRVESKRIYAITFREEEGKKELYILDLKGRILKKTMVELQEINPRELNPYTIHEGKLYQLSENENTEEWELQVSSLID
jgi:hypothetical protein